MRIAAARSSLTLLACLSTLAGQDQSFAKALMLVGEVSAASPLGVNSDGIVVGYRSGGPGGAVVWDYSGAVHDLNDLIHPDWAISGVRLTSAHDINDQGWIIGMADKRHPDRAESEPRGFILIPVAGEFSPPATGRVEGLLADLGGECGGFRIVIPAVPRQ